MSKNKKIDFREDYTDDQLNSMYTKQLIHLRNGIRGKRSSHANYAGHRCCEICKEYIGDDWDGEIKSRLDELDLYLNRIKKILSTREHIPGKIEAKAIRQAKAKKRR